MHTSITLKRMKKLIYIVWLIPFLSVSQFSLEDSLRGSITPERSWWNLLRYDLEIKVDPILKSIIGKNIVTFAPLLEEYKMQIDLQEPMILDSVLFENEKLEVKHTFNNIYYIHFNQGFEPEHEYHISIYYHGTPTEAKRPPWDGGITWKTSKNGLPIITSTCQGVGASIWWPCKDHMYDEPENGITISVNSPSEVMDVSNGKLIENRIEDDGTRTCVWEVKNPINNYGVNMNIAPYLHWSDTFIGEKGKLPLDFYVLPENLEKSKVQFKDANRTLTAFEYWFGPYPFYDDGYKLVEVPYLGMEHQSSVTYGNGYKNGYLGTDLSGTGWGLKWDYIIVHESGHEWFANNITYKDIADMWIHESFTTYSEGLFVEYYFGETAGSEYIRGMRKNILNDKPIIGQYNVNSEGSGDMYYKGSNFLHTMRQVIDNDSLWRAILRGLNSEFHHQTVTTKQIEDFISMQSEIDFQLFFDQYLRTKQIPKLRVEQRRKKIYYRWENVVKGFDMPIDVSIDGAEYQRVYPKTNKQCVKGKKIVINPDFYIRF